jgi:3-oxoacyl-[acyl-carrier protein] reductase
LNLGLQDRVAAVTGGSRGLGYAIAQSVLAEGCRVAICARDQARLDTATRTLGQDVFARAADVGKVGEVEAFIEAAASHFGALDILVHNAGGGGGAGLESPDAEFAQSLEVNALAGLRAARAAVPFMRRQHRGRIIFIASVWGRESGGRTGYNMAKAAEISLAKALSRELAKDNILVNSVAPGSLMFPGGSWERRQQADPDGMAAYVKSELPLGRFGTPEEVAAVVTFLASDRASLVTGASWTVDGGQSRSLI